MWQNYNLCNKREVMNKKGKITVIVLALALATALILPVSLLAAGYTLYENYTSGFDTYNETYSTYWHAQSFTTNESHSVNELLLALYGEGTSGTLTVSIKEMGSNGLYPAGGDLCSGTLSDIPTVGNWYSIPVDEYNLETNTTYAIVIRGTGADENNTVKWGYDSAGATYTGGQRYYSTNGGASWTNVAGSDFLFMVYGNPSMEIYGVNVFADYMESGDWLFTVSGLNIFEPYYSEKDSKGSFLLQLTKADDTLIAQTPLTAWGYKPTSIYLSSATAATLDWGAGYKVKFYEIGGDNYNTSYTLTSADWRGAELSILDDWSLTTARAMENYYSTDFIVSTATKGDVLNEEGGVMFTIGIPYLDAIRPGIFQIVVSTIDYTPPSWGSSYEEGLPTWETAIGPSMTTALTSVGGLINLDGKNTGILLVILLYVAVATAAFAGTGHGVAGLALASPILILGVYFRFIPFAAMGVAIALIMVLLVRELWWGRT